MPQSPGSTVVKKSCKNKLPPVVLSKEPVCVECRLQSVLVHLLRVPKYYVRNIYGSLIEAQTTTEAASVVCWPMRGSNSTAVLQVLLPIVPGTTLILLRLYLFYILTAAMIIGDIKFICFNCNHIYDQE